MRKVEAGMVDAIWWHLHSDKSGQIFKSGNTTVSIIHEGIRGTYSYHRTIEVALHDNVIAVIDPSLMRIKLSNCGWETTTTKSRLNVLIECFTDMVGIHQHQHVWYQGDSLFDRECEGRFMLKDPDDHWQTRQAFAIA